MELNLKYLQVAKFAFTVYAIASGMNLDQKLNIKE